MTITDNSRHRRPVRARLVSSGAGLIAITLAGCGFFPGDSVEVDLHSDTPLNVVFQQVIDTRQPARLGDVVTQAGLPVETWDRMYAFHSVRDEEELNTALGVDIEWEGVSGGSDSTFVQVFTNNGEIVYAFADWPPRYAVGR